MGAGKVHAKNTGTVVANFHHGVLPGGQRVKGGKRPHRIVHVSLFGVQSRVPFIPLTAGSGLFAIVLFFVVHVFVVEWAAV